VTTETTDALAAAFAKALSEIEIEPAKPVIPKAVPRNARSARIAWYAAVAVILLGLAIWAPTVWLIIGVFVFATWGALARTAHVKGMSTIDNALTRSAEGWLKLLGWAAYVIVGAIVTVAAIYVLVMLFGPAILHAIASGASDAGQLLVHYVISGDTGPVGWAKHLLSGLGK
jgi:hypothetical protein